MTMVTTTVFCAPALIVLEYANVSTSFPSLFSSSKAASTVAPLHTGELEHVILPSSAGTVANDPVGNLATVVPESSLEVGITIVSTVSPPVVMNTAEGATLNVGTTVETLRPLAVSPSTPAPPNVMEFGVSVRPEMATVKTSPSLHVQRSAVSINLKISLSVSSSDDVWKVGSTVTLPHVSDGVASHVIAHFPA